ncbi:MvaI/BcnI family restriction endonuclease [Rhodovibrionaceae bacterium A322]
MSISSIDQFRNCFRNEGVDRIYIKILAPKQDNEKNQIVLANQLEGLVNAFPAQELRLREPSSSTKKRNSATGRPIEEAHLNFFWLDERGNRFHAPDTKLIEYFQYPETRLSGFIKGCKWVPAAIRRTRQAEFGKRILGIGANRAGEVFGLLLTEWEDPLVEGFPELPPSGVSGVLGILNVTGQTKATPQELLTDELRRIVKGGWHPSIRNKGGTIVPFKGNQGAGYTLEALLGVETNALKEPDAYGHEIKSFRGDKISLMTPTADMGAEGDLTFRDFMMTYGWEGKRGDGSFRFTGVHRAGKRSNSTGYLLGVSGFDPASKEFSDNPDEIFVGISDPDTGSLIGGWSLEKLANSWNTKHALAAYMSAGFREDPAGGGDQYCFSAPWFMCEGTDVWRLLRAIASGLVYYDPAHTIYADGSAKVRPQWRIGTSRLEAALRELYARVSKVS